MSAAVAAPRARVWAALTDPAEIVHWRPGLVAPRQGADRYPRAGETVRWRCRVRELPIVLRETPLEVVAGERLASRIHLGLFRFEASFTLAPLASDPPRTRVGLQIQVANELPVVGGTLDRFAARRLATELAATELMALRDWCEAQRPRERAPAPALLAAAAL
jgi:uncharacterized protein YndB with AHSA1/START domain